MVTWEGHLPDGEPSEARSLHCGVSRGALPALGQVSFLQVPLGLRSER